MTAVLALAFAAAPAQSGDIPVLSTSAWIVDAPTKIALALGAFDDMAAGPIRVERTNSGAESLARLLAGEAEFATMAPTPIAQYVCRLSDGTLPESAARPVILASMALSNGTHFVLADGAAGIERPGDLAGRRVGVMFDTSAHFGWHRFVRHHGLSDAGIELVDRPIDRLPAALLDGEVDAAVLWSPWQRRAVERLGGDARRFEIRPVDSVNWLLVASRDIVESRPALVAEVLQAYLRAVDLLNAEPDRAVALFSRVAERELSNADALSGVIWHLTLDWSVLANFQANVEWYERRHGTEQLDVSLKRFIDPGPLSAVAPEKVVLPASVREAGGAR